MKYFYNTSITYMFSSGFFTCALIKLKIFGVLQSLSVSSFSNSIISKYNQCPFKKKTVKELADREGTVRLTGALTKPVRISQKIEVLP